MNKYRLTQRAEAEILEIFLYGIDQFRIVSNRAERRFWEYLALFNWQLVHLKQYRPKM